MRKHQPKTVILVRYGRDNFTDMYGPFPNMKTAKAWVKYAEFIQPSAVYYMSAVYVSKSQIKKALGE